MIRLVPGLEGKARMGQAVWALMFLAVFALSLVVRPSSLGHGTHTQLGLPPCPSVIMFGRPCPGCGMTTCFAYSARLNFVSAFQAHPLGPLLFLGWGLTAVLAAYGVFRGLRLDTDSRSFQWLLACYAIAFFAYGAVRFTQGFSRAETVTVAATP